MLEQKLVKIYDLGSKIDPLLNDGWRIKKISSCASSGSTWCWVLLERRGKKKPSENFNKK